MTRQLKRRAADCEDGVSSIELSRSGRPSKRRKLAPSPHDSLNGVPSSGIGEDSFENAHGKRQKRRATDCDDSIGNAEISLSGRPSKRPRLSPSSHTSSSGIEEDSFSNAHDDGPTIESRGDDDNDNSSGIDFGGDGWIWDNPSMLRAALEKPDKRFPGLHPPSTLLSSDEQRRLAEETWAAGRAERARRQAQYRLDQDNYIEFRRRKQQEKEASRWLRSPSPDISPQQQASSDPEADEYGRRPSMFGLGDNDGARIKEVFGAEYARGWRARLQRRREQRLREEEEERKQRLREEEEEYRALVDGWPGFGAYLLGGNSTNVSRPRKQSPEARKVRKQSRRRMESRMPVSLPQEPPPPASPEAVAPKVILEKTSRRPPKRAPKRAPKKTLRKTKTPKRTPLADHDGGKAPPEALETGMNGNGLAAPRRLTRQQRSSSEAFYELDQRGKPRLV